MSLDIWTQCGGLSRVQPIGIVAWRVVEAQHIVSTRRLVDTLEEQALLEDIVDDVKPPRPLGPKFDGLHFLLFTPFRHPPLRHGSRFGLPTDRGLWYGAKLIETSLAEKAYYQFLFAAGTSAKLENLSCFWSAFQADIKAQRGVDLAADAFSPFQSEISSPSSYLATQRLGSDMRAAGVEVFTFSSARCPQKGMALGLIEPAFADPNPLGASQTWACILTGHACEVGQVNATASKVLVFKRSGFEVNGALPTPGAS
jgi:RES domain